MRFDDGFSIPLPREEVWRAFQDLAMIGGCMPGATVTEVDGDRLQGTVRLRVGPMALTYAGTGEVIERDPGSGTMRLRLRGKDAKGGGTASAEVAAVLTGVGGGTEVSVETELALTGRPAQFGRGVLADVSASLMRQFADRLEQQLRPGDAAETAGSTGSAGGAGRVAGAGVGGDGSGSEDVALDAGRLALDILRARRTEVGVAVGTLAVLLVAVRRARRRHRSRRRTR